MYVDTIRLNKTKIESINIEKLKTVKHSYEYHYLLSNNL